MAKLSGFKFTVNRYIDCFSDSKINYLEYAILSVSDGKFLIDAYKNGEKHHFDITDKIDTFYNEIKRLGIDKWNMHFYESSICWMPPADVWTLEIHIEDISVTCKGQDATPENWNEFWNAFHRMCNNE